MRKAIARRKNGLRARGRDPRAPADRRRAVEKSGALTTGLHPGELLAARWRPAPRSRSRCRPSRKEWDLGHRGGGSSTTPTRSTDGPQPRREHPPRAELDRRTAREPYHRRQVPGAPVAQVRRHRDPDSLELVAELEDEHLTLDLGLERGACASPAPAWHRSGDGCGRWCAEGATRRLPRPRRGAPDPGRRRTPVAAGQDPGGRASRSPAT